LSTASLASRLSQFPFSVHLVPYSLSQRIVSSNLLNAQEIDIFKAVLAWGVHECKRRAEVRG
jgi:hypothetical protein